MGAGSWGTALACHLAGTGHAVRLWSRRADHVAEIIQTRENKRYLPGVVIPPNIAISADIGTCLNNTDAVVFAVPSHAFSQVVTTAKSLIPLSVPIVNVAKGIEEDSLRLLSQVWADLTGDTALDWYCSLSGPSHAEEVGRAMPTALVAASRSANIARYVQDLFMSSSLRVYTNPDLTGVETGGALKNIIAIATGISDGLGFGDNTRAAIMTRGLAEISRLGVRLGAHPLTLGGLTGVGDLIVTCTSMHSRNRRFGMAIGRGLNIDEALTQVGMVVEGLRTTKAATRLSARLGVELPITNLVHAVLFEGLPPQEGVDRLMTRNPTREIEETTRLSLTWQE